MQKRFTNTRLEGDRAIDSRVHFDGYAKSLPLVETGELTIPMGWHAPAFLLHFLTKSQATRQVKSTAPRGQGMVCTRGTTIAVA
jgi:hypothetical protein